MVSSRVSPASSLFVPTSSITSSLESVPEAFEIGSAAKLAKEFGKAADSEIKAAVIPLRNLLDSLFLIISFLSQNL